MWRWIGSAVTWIAARGSSSWRDPFPELLEPAPPPPECALPDAQRATMGRVQPEQLAHTVAQRAMMPSTSDRVSYLRAQLAHREAQLEQVCAERESKRKKF